MPGTAHEMHELFIADDERSGVLSLTSATPMCRHESRSRRCIPRAPPRPVLDAANRQLALEGVPAPEYPVDSNILVDVAAVPRSNVRGCGSFTCVEFVVASAGLAALAGGALSTTESATAVKDVE